MTDDKMLAGLLEIAIKASLEAGAATLEHVPSVDEAPETKGDGSPVTRADMASHHCIMRHLERAEPAFPIVSEESYSADKTDMSDPAKTYWLVDPLDGTRDFLKGLPEFTVNIALVKNLEPVLGVVFAPSSGTLYHAAAGAGSFKAIAGGTPLPISARRELAADGLTAAVSRSHSSQETTDFIEHHGIGNVIRSGSSIKICLVAEGAADVYPRLGNTSLWDTAAGTAVAREAGCRVVDLEGGELVYDYSRGIRHHGFMVYSPHTFEP